MVAGLNHANIDLACLGNHEFDIGFDGLKERMSAFKGKVINTNTDNQELAAFPKHFIVQVGDRSVLFVGLVTGDPSIYIEGKRPMCRAFVEACATAWAEAEAAGATLDALVPMTHQLMPEDREFAEALAKHPTFEGKVPVILGGHEHVVFNETVGGALIIKGGQDAENIAFVDVWWTSEGSMQTRCVLKESKEFPAEPHAAAWVERQNGWLEKAMEMPLATLPSAGTTKGVRREPSTVVSFLLSLTKRGFQEQRVDAAIIHGGAVRAQRDYQAGDRLTLGSLFAELAFDPPMAVVQLPGSVLAAAIRASRNGEGEKPGFLHADGGVEVDGENEVLRVDGQALDQERTYTVCVAQVLLAGMNNIQPLADFGKSTSIPDLEACHPVRSVIIETCMKDAWRRYLGKEGHTLTRQEIKAQLADIFAKLDADHNGFITPDELSEFLHKHHDDLTAALLSSLIGVLDSNRDGKVSLEEFSSLAR